MDLYEIANNIEMEICELRDVKNETQLQAHIDVLEAYANELYKCCKVSFPERYTDDKTRSVLDGLYLLLRSLSEKSRAELLESAEYYLLVEKVGA